MFVIADNRQKVPVYLWKVSHGTTFITHYLSEAKLFKSIRGASDLLETLRPDSTFEFKVHELGIIA